MKKIFVILTILLFFPLLSLNAEEIIDNMSTNEKYYQNANNTIKIKIYLNENVLKYDVITGEVNNGFNRLLDSNNNEFVFYLDENIVFTGLNEIENDKYAFDENGKMLFGLKKINSNTFYFDLNSGKAKTGIVNDNKKTYYFNENGIKVEGLVTYNNNLYYFTKDNMYKNKFFTTNKKTYYFNKNGQAVKGIQTINKKTYYFNQNYELETGLVNYNSKLYYINDGKMYTSTFINVNKKTYYFNKNGQAVKGLKKINKKWYYFTDNYYKKDGLAKTGNYLYYVKKGSLYKSQWVKVDGKKYYFNKKGHAVKGLKKINKKWYYFTDEYYKKDGLFKIGKYYYYIKKGKKYTSKWVTINGKKYYFNKKGHAVSGKQKIKKKYYYFNPTTCALENGLYKENGNYYYIESGILFSNRWKKIDGKWYYFSSNGAAYKNKIVKIAKVTYKFNSSAYAVNESGKTYFKNASGKKIKGWKYVYGTLKLFDSKGNYVATGQKVIDISEFQGKIDWKALKKGTIKDSNGTDIGKVDGVIIRIGFTGYGSEHNKVEDARFEYNLSQAQKYNIPIGIYYYGYSTTQAEAVKEAAKVKFILNSYKNPKLDYGIYYDAEVSGIGREAYEIVIPTFVDNIKGLGYKVGVYGSASPFFGDNGFLNSSKIKQYPLWVAHYSTSCSDHYFELEDCGYKNFTGWQFTSSGKVSGISTRVDLDLWYRK